MFFIDFCGYLNGFKLKLQGENKTIIVMFNLIKPFEAKLKTSPNINKVSTDMETNEKSVQIQWAKNLQK